MTDRKHHLDTAAVSLLVACCAFWGFQQILIKTTVAEVPPLWQATIRMAGATMLLWLWCAARGVRLFERDGTLAGGLLVGVLFACEFACIYLGLQYTTASRLTVFLYTSPFVVTWSREYCEADSHLGGEGGRPPDAMEAIQNAATSYTICPGSAGCGQTGSSRLNNVATGL